jgi:hypothetical protein
MNTSKGIQEHMLKTSNHSKCFYTKQINLENFTATGQKMAEHIHMCTSCSAKIEALHHQEKDISKYIAKFRATSEIADGLRSELLQTLDDLKFASPQSRMTYRETVNNIDKGLKNFLMNFLRPFEMGMILLAVASFAGLYMLFRPI